MPNVVEIIVRAKDMTGEGFGKAEAKATGLGTTLTKFAAFGGAALAVVGVEAVRMASKFDQSMEMLATQADVPQAKIAGLKSGVLALASQVGFSPDSLAESLYHVASNMVSMGATSQEMLGIVKVAAEGARIGNANLVDVTNALTSAVASGIPGVKNYSQAMGMLNAIVGTGDMHMQDLADSFSTGLLPVMKLYGLSLKDVGAALATFGDLNIRGQDAATKLRMAVQAMTAPTMAGADHFREMGMGVHQLASDIRSGGLMQGLLDLQKHYAAVGITGTKVGQALTVDFGKRAGVGLAVLLGNMERLQSKYPLLAKGANDFGGAWQATLKQTSTMFAQLKGWAEALMISIGEKLLPVVKSFGEWMLRNKTAVEITLGVLSALVAVIGTYVLVTKAVVIATEIWTVVQKLLNGEMMMNPIGLIVTAIALLVIGIIEAYKHSAAFRDIVHETGVVAREAFGWILHAAEETFDWIKGHWRLLLAILLGPIGLAVDAISAHWRWIMRSVSQLVDWIRTAWNAMFGILRGPVMLAVDVIMDLWHQILQGVDQLVGWIEAAWSAVYGILVTPVEQAWHDIEPILNTIGGFLSSVGGGLSKVGSFFGLASGGISGAATGGPRGGFTMVGEYGPELVRLPYGSQVYSNAQSGGMLGGGHGGGSKLEVLLTFQGTLLKAMQAEVRSAGGDPLMFQKKVTYR